MNDAISFLHFIINFGVKSEKKFGKLLVILQNYRYAIYREAHYNITFSDAIIKF